MRHVLGREEPGLIGRMAILDQITPNVLGQFKKKQGLARATTDATIPTDLIKFEIQKRYYYFCIPKLLKLNK